MLTRDIIYMVVGIQMVRLEGWEQFDIIYQNVKCVYFRYGSRNVLKKWVLELARADCEHCGSLLCILNTNKLL